MEIKYNNSISKKQYIGELTRTTNTMIFVKFNDRLDMKFRKKDGREVTPNEYNFFYIDKTELERIKQYEQSKTK